MGADRTQVQALSLVSSSVPILNNMANCLLMFMGPGLPYTLDGLPQATYFHQSFMYALGHSCMH